MRRSGSNRFAAGACRRPLLTMAHGEPELPIAASIATAARCPSHRSRLLTLVAALALGLGSTVAPAAAAQAAAPATAPPAQVPAPAGTTAKPPTPTELGGIETPADYVVGIDDVLAIVFWREKEMSSEVTVRPDSMISLPLINDIRAAGLTPEQLRVKVSEAASRFVEEPTVTVVVKAINSRKVFITGQIAKIGAYPLGGSTTVLQLIAMAGGLLEYADSKKITILRNEGGKQVTMSFNYRDVAVGRNLKQNVELKPGDTVVVP